MTIKLLAAEVVIDEEDGATIRSVPLLPDGTFVHGLQLLHGECLRILINDGSGEVWEYIRIDPSKGPVKSILPVDDDGNPV